MSNRSILKPRKDRTSYGAVFDSDRPVDSRIFRAESDGDFNDGNISTDDGYSDTDIPMRATDEFLGGQTYSQKKGTGRQRKKVASRGKGGEFQAKRKKRRAYACCIGSEIDTIRLVEYFKDSSNAIAGGNWCTQMYTDTLRVHRNAASVRSPDRKLIDTGEGDEGEPLLYSYDTGETRTLGKNTFSHRDEAVKDLSVKFHDPYCKEIFVYEFGAVVFWGFPAGDELELLDVFRDFVSKGRVPLEESIAVYFFINILLLS